MPHRFTSIVIAVALAGFGLLGLGQLRPAAGQNETPPAPAASIEVDPRWLALLHETQSAAALTPTLNVNLTDGLVAGHVPSGSPVSIRMVRSPYNYNCGPVMPVPDSDGFFFAASCGSPYGYQAGDVVWATQGATVMSLTVPALSALAYPTADVISGTAPASATLTVDVFPFDAAGVAQSQIVTATAAGEYQAALAVRPRDTGYVRYAPQPERQVYVRFIAPFLRVQVNGKVVSGSAAPWSEVYFTVSDAQGRELTGQYASAYGDGQFFSFDYCAYYKTPCLSTLHPGYQVTAHAAGQTFSATVAALTASANPAAGQITGEAPPNAPVDISVYTGPLNTGQDALAAQTTVTASASGQYTATLSLPPTAYGTATITDAEENQTYARFAAPVLGVRLLNANVTPTWWYQTQLLWGQVNETSAPITVSIQGPSGYLKDLRSLVTDDTGYFVDNLEPSKEPPPFALMLDTGDVLTVTTPNGPALHLTVPQLTAEANAISNTVTGLAPPNAALTITVYGDSTMLTTTADAQGAYTADFSGVGNFVPSTSGEVQWATPEGHTIVRVFATLPLCIATFGPMQVGGNEALLYHGGNCPLSTVRLLSAAGQVKYEITEQWLYYYSLTLFDAIGRPIPILSGDRFEYVSAAGAIFTTTIPTLTIAIDPAANTVTGQAPPGEIVELKTANVSLTTTASAQGAYTFSVASLHTFVAGDVATVFINNGAFSTLDVVPVLRATLGRDFAGATLPPLTPFTLTAIGGELATGYAPSDGILEMRIPINLMPGQPLTLTTPAQTLTMTLASLSARLDRATGMVTGTAPPNSRLRVDINDASYKPWVLASQMVTATATGAFTTTFPELAAIDGVNGALTHFDAQGNQTTLNFGPARWDVVLDVACIGGVAPTLDLPVTVVLQTPDGTVHPTTSGGHPGWSGAFSACFDAPVQSGSLLTLTTLGNDVMTFTVPIVTAHHDFAAQTLTGQALPNSFLTAMFQMLQPSWYYPPVMRQVPTEANGHYGLDTHGMGLSPGQTGYVFVTDAGGNTVRRNFTVEGYLTYLPMVGRGP